MSHIYDISMVYLFPILEKNVDRSYFRGGTESVITFISYSAVHLPHPYATIGKPATCLK